MGVSAMGNTGAGTGCGEQTGSSCSEIPEAKDQGQKCKCAETWKSLLYPDMDCAALQGALGLGTGAGAWARSVVLLLAWGKPLPSPDLSYPQSCTVPSHDILAGGTSQSQLKNTVTDGSAVVQGWPDVIKGRMPPAGVTHCHSGLPVSFLWPVTPGLCSMLSRAG